MKRAFAILALAALLTGCGSSKAPAATTAPTAAPTETTVAAAPAPAPLEILETVWAAIPEDSKFPACGGEMTDTIQEGPGALDPANTDVLLYTLLVPEEQVANVKEAASLIHMMNTNTFTCGAFRLEGVTDGVFADAMKNRILSNQWMCGFPERLIIASFGDDTVLCAYGKNSTLDPFMDQLTKAYSGQMVLLVDEPIE